MSLHGLLARGDDDAGQRSRQDLARRWTQNDMEFFFKLTHEMTKYLYTVFPKTDILFIFFNNMKT